MTANDDIRALSDRVLALEFKDETRKEKIAELQKKLDSIKILSPWNYRVVVLASNIILGLAALVAGLIGTSKLYEAIETVKGVFK